MTNHLIIGHRAAREFLEKSIESGRLAQAYLFVGAAGLGKKRVAEWFIRKIMEKMDSRFRGNDVAGGSNFQIRLVERVHHPKTGKKNKEISIDQIHEARDFLSHSAFLGKIKAVIIEGAESLNAHAANALLKVLEEPTPGSLLILLAENSEEALPTIVSRCQVARFNSVADKEIYEGLLARGAAPDLAGEISRRALGIPGRAIELYEQPEKLKVDKEQRENFFRILTSPTLAEGWRLLEPYYKKKQDHIEGRDFLTKVLENWALACRDLLMDRVKAAELLSEDPAAAPAFGAAKIAAIIELLRQSIEWLNQNIHPKLVLENLILDIKYST